MITYNCDGCGEVIEEEDVGKVPLDSRYTLFFHVSPHDAEDEEPDEDEDEDEDQDDGDEADKPDVHYCPKCLRGILTTALDYVPEIPDGMPGSKPTGIGGEEVPGAP